MEEADCGEEEEGCAAEREEDERHVAVPKVRGVPAVEGLGIEEAEVQPGVWVCRGWADGVFGVRVERGEGVEGLD